MLAEQLDAVLFCRDGLWHGQFLQYDIGAQAESLEDLFYELHVSLVSFWAICAENHVDPREQRQAAPQHYWDLHRGALRIESRPGPAFRLPSGAARVPEIAAWLADTLTRTESAVQQPG